MGEMDGENGLGHVEELDESNDLEVVEFTDEEGTTYTAAILAVLQVDDSDYAVLAPIEQLEDEDGNEFFSYIEDEATFAKVQQAATALLDEGAEIGEA